MRSYSIKWNRSPDTSLRQASRRSLSWSSTVLTILLLLLQILALRLSRYSPQSRGFIWDYTTFFCFKQSRLSSFSHQRFFSVKRDRPFWFTLYIYYWISNKRAFLFLPSHFSKERFPIILVAPASWVRRKKRGVYERNSASETNAEKRFLERLTLVENGFDSMMVSSEEIHPKYWGDNIKNRLRGRT